MAFWSSERLKNAIHTTNLIQPRKGCRVKQCAYELSVAAEYFVTSESSGTKHAERYEQIRIPPGQLALLVTQETINMPANTIGFISMKFRYKMQGLVNVSGFHVDPGFSGRLKFSVYNAGSKEAYFNPGQALFLIWFSELTDGDGASYDGEHQHQDGISADDVYAMQGEMASPAQLRKELDAVKQELVFLRAIGIPIAVLIAGIFIRYVLVRPEPAQLGPPAGSTGVSVPVNSATRTKQAQLSASTAASRETGSTSGSGKKSVEVPSKAR